MRRRRRNERGTVVVTALILAVAGIYLCFRAWETAHTAMAPVVTIDPRGGSSAIPLVIRAEAQDTLLASVEMPARDPFQSPRIRRDPVRTKVVRTEDPPVLRMILYDQISPEVQFSVEGVLSGRLKPGQSFSGWTVTSISPRSCLVRKDDRTLTLSPRR